MPTVPFSYIGSSNYKSQSSSCYLLNDYSSDNPAPINISSFLSLYSGLIKKCPLSIKAI